PQHGDQNDPKWSEFYKVFRHGSKYVLQSFRIQQIMNGYHFALFSRMLYFNPQRLQSCGKNKNQHRQDSKKCHWMRQFIPEPFNAVEGTLEKIGRASCRERDERERSAG